VTLRLRGRLLPDGEHRDVYVVDGRFTFTHDGPATTLLDGGWLVPGLVDCHAHLSMSSPAGDAPPLDRVRASALAQRDAGVLLVREPGSPDLASAELDGADGLPRVLTAGRFLAAPGRYFPGLAREVEPAGLPEAVRQEAAGAGGWVKVIGDFFQPGGRIEPSWSAADLRAAATAAHEAGARIAVHATDPVTIGDALAAGFDSIEHGTGMTRELVEVLAEQGAAWVPTLLVGDGVRALANAMDPAGGRAVHGWLDALPGLVVAAANAGVTVLAGTDAGMVPHGWIVREVERLLAAGVPAAAALAAASWAARRYLGAPLIEEGAPADLLAFPDDPRSRPELLTRPALILLRGEVVTPARS
jgi:imidazolonepropionase-like amidohydrolase